MRGTSLIVLLAFLTATVSCEKNDLRVRYEYTINGEKDSVYAVYRVYDDTGTARLQSELIATLPWKKTLTASIGESSILGMNFLVAEHEYYLYAVSEAPGTMQVAINGGGTTRTLASEARELETRSTVPFQNAHKIVYE